MHFDVEKKPRVARDVRIDVARVPLYGNSTLPLTIRSRMVDNINGLAMHVLEAGFETKERPCILLLHGFPELAYSWRKVMLPMAAAGYHVVAPDQRGYGRTTGWDDAYDGDLDLFRIPNFVRDALGLLSALGYLSVAAVIGHDFGSPVAAYCAVIRPDVFRSLALMSAPFGGPPPLPFNTAGAPAPSVTPVQTSVFEDLAKLDRPRKYYQQYYRTREANDNMWRAPQGIHAFMRAYYHFKSADWKQNQPFKLAAFTANELAKMPTYYVMDLPREWRRPLQRKCHLQRRSLHANGLPMKNWLSTPPNLVGPDFRAACNGTDALAANTPPSLKRSQAAPSMCRLASLPAKAIGVSTRTPVRLREWKPSPLPNGAVLIWLMARDIGYNRSSRRTSVDCCCNSFADENRRTLSNRSVEPVLHRVSGP